MTTHPYTRHVRGLVLVLGATALSVGALLTPASAAPAPGPVSAHVVDRAAAATARTDRAVRTQAVVTEAAVRVALLQRGDPYQYGAAGPHRFDCSGLVQFAFKRAGQTVPRTSAEQARAARRIAPGNARRGDLVFFYDRGGVYHVGFYMGDGRMLNAPRTGAVVRIDEIWSDQVYFGRVR